MSSEETKPDASAQTKPTQSSPALSKPATPTSMNVSRFVVILGAIFTIVPLILTVMVQDLNQSSYQIIKIVLALGCAGVAAGIPGVLEADLHNGIKAGGAIAVFVIIYFFSPAALTKSSSANGTLTNNPTPAPSVAPTPVSMASLTTPFDVEVVTNDTDGVEMRASPNDAHSMFMRLAQKSKLSVQGKYKDVDNHRWWPVQLKPGWISDGDTDLTKPRMLKAIGGGDIGPDTLVEVTYPQLDGLIWRANFGKDGAPIAYLLRGSKMRVTGNSQTKDGRRWWPVKVAIGWVAEGPADNPQEAWIKPLQR
jgi:hypothetical protein